MEDRILQLAKKTISPDTAYKSVFRIDGQTEDIIDVIKKDWRASVLQTKEFSKHLRNMYKDDRILMAIYNFLLNNVRLEIDPLGEQYVKKPVALIHQFDRKADCKSYSLFISSVLTNLHIPHIFRFVSFDKFNKNVQHVYIVAYPNTRKETYLDVNLKMFNKQKKPFFNNIDINMTKIYSIGAVPTASVSKNKGLLGGRDFYKIGDAEMDLRIGKQRLEIERDIIAEKRGIGSLQVEKYNDAISVVDDAIGVILAMEKTGNTHVADAALGMIADDAIHGRYSIATQLSGIGDYESRKRLRKKHLEKLRANRRIRKNIRVGALEDDAVGKTKLGKFLKKAAKSVKKGVKAAEKAVTKAAKATGKGLAKAAKAVAKVVTTPLRLIAKGILEISLPKASPFFLYLFITDKNIIAKLPAKVKKKRAKAERVKKFIVNGIGMKEKHFMGIVRNGITKHYKKSPEAVLAEYTKGISGIGAFPIAIVGVLIDIINKIASVIKGKKKESVSADDAPDSSDWAELSQSASSALATAIRTQTSNQNLINTFTSDAPALQENGNDEMMNYAPESSEIITDKTEKETEFSDGGRNVTGWCR